MSEDSIAWGRAEAGAPLPPRKRLLAGFKQNGWSPSSSPSYSGPLQDTLTKVSLSAGSNDGPDASMVEGYRKDGAYTASPVKLEDSPHSASLLNVEEQGEDNLNTGSMAKLDSSLDSSPMVKLEEHDACSTEHGYSEYASFAAESMDLYHFRQRKSKRLRALPVVVAKETKKKAVSADDFRKRKFKCLRVVGTEKMKRKVLVSVSEEEILHAEGFSLTDTDKYVDASAVVGEVSFDTSVIAMTPTEREERDAMAAVKVKEEKTGCNVPAAVWTIKEEAGKDAIVACADKFKPGLSICCKAEDDESVCCEVSKPTWNHRSKVKEEDGKPRRNQSRQHHDRIKESDRSMREVQTERGSQTPPPLSDEELARQLHRIMNCSRRISRRLIYKEYEPLLSPNCK